MKLSDIKGERSLDVIADLLDPIYSIASDKEAAKLFEKQKLPKGVSKHDFGAKWLKECTTKILKAHKKECIDILSIIEGVTAEEYTENLNLVKLLTDVMDLISDEVFTSLFFSTEQSSGIFSGSALVNTEGTKAQKALSDTQ